MDTGGVENPGAVNSRDDDASATSEQELMDTPIEDNGINFDVVSDSTEATNEEKEYNFSSKDISKREKTDYFVNVAGAEKRAKKAEKDKLKQERRSRKEMLKEASKSKADEAKERNAKEAAKNREAKHIREKYRFEKFRGFVWRYKVIIISVITVVTLAVLGVIFVPIIIANINAAQKEQVIRENKTDIMKIFEQVAGKEFTSREEFEKVVKGVSSEVEIEYYMAGIGKVYAKNKAEWISFDADNNGEDFEKIRGFAFYIYDEEKEVSASIYYNGDNILLAYGLDDYNMDSIKDALGELLLRMEGKNE